MLKKTGMLLAAVLVAGAALLLKSKAGEEAEIRMVPEYQTFKQLAGLPLMDIARRDAWKKAVPGIEEIGIPRANGEADQQALWYHSGTSGKKPLLLVLHSWSATYLQHYAIPYGVFAQRNDWIFIHPNYRGHFDNPKATASEESVRDVREALAYARRHAPVDDSRIYLAGFSGGAMMALIMAGRFPDEFTAALAWVPVYDLRDWYRTVIQSEYRYTEEYKQDIEASCGGRPDTDEEAAEECRRRSPSAYLENARGKGVKIFIAGGIHDHFVPPSHAIRAFNALADDRDRVAESDYRAIDSSQSLPGRLAGQAAQDKFFDDAGLPVIFSRQSKDAVLYIFEGGHDIAFNAGFKWLSKQRR